MKLHFIAADLLRGQTKALLAVISLMLLVVAVAAAQAFLGSISGMVTDPTGAVVSNVKVTVTDNERGVPFTVFTNQNGVYFVKNLLPSSYKITAEAPGFQTYQLSTFPLTAKQDAIVNITLQLGTASQTVEVSSQVQMVEPSNATLGAVVNSKSISDLPLVNRNILTLMVLQPGVTPSTPNSYQSTFFTSAIRYSFNGGLESTSDFQLDGVSILNQSDIAGIMGLTLLPSVEGVQEMRVQTNSYSAAYGRSGGGITTMVSKSGTNTFHGDVFDYFRNDALNATNFFTNRSGAKKPALHINQYGGSLGGPIIKNKTFFFGLLEITNNHSSGFGLFSVPTDTERNGDFSQVVNQAGQVKTIYNPFSTVPDPNNPGQFIRSPFPGNQIPKSMMDPIGVKAASYWPKPNLPGTAIAGTSLYAPVNNLALTAGSSSPMDQVTVKVDHNFSANKRGFLRYGYLYSVSGSPNYWRNLADQGAGPMTVRAHNVALGYTQTFGSSTVLDLRAAANRFNAFRPSNGLGFLVTELGLPESLQTYLRQGDVDEFPGIGVQGYSTLGNNNGPYYSVQATNYIFSGTLSRVVGRHTLTVGAEQKDYFLAYFQTNPLLLNFTNGMTQGPNALAVSPAAGDGVASLLLGTGSSGSATYYAKPANANHYFGEFVQDDIKWTPKFTMNIGFRLEEETATTERYNRMSAIDPFVLNPISNQVTNPFTGQKPWNLYGGYIFPGSGSGSLGRRAIRPLEWKPSPRIGIAYSLNDKTVIRAGYGIFFSVPFAGATREFTGSAFTTSTPWIASLDGIRVNTTLSNAFPANLSSYIYPPGSSNGLLSAIGQSLASAWPTSLRTAYNQQWNFSVQRSLTESMMLQLAYVGNKGTHLNWFNESGVATMNQIQPQYMSLKNDLLKLVPNPFYGVITSGTLAQPEVQAGQLLRPFPAWQTVSPNGIAIGNSEYQALQVTFQKRYTRGLSFTAGYTWAKLMSDVADGIWNDASYIGSGAYRSWYCLRCEHSVSSYDVPHRFTLSIVAELPFGRGKTFGSGWNRLTNAILGGWQTNGIVTLAVGQPLVFFTAQNNSYTFGGGQHPDVVGNPVLASGKSIYQWFNTAAFAQPANFTSGNLGRTYTGVRADWTKNLDLSLFKNFVIREKFQVQFRAESFNFTNTPTFAAPGTTLGSSNFGLISSQANSPRNVQLAMKIIF